jgi:SCF-associated factor 1
MQQELTPRFSYGTKRLTTPTLLQTGNETQPKIKFRSISSGRAHVIGLARDGTVWHWSNHVTLQRVDIEDRIVQVAANWNYSSALTADGKLLVIPQPDLIIQSQLEEEPAPTVLVAAAVSVSDMLPDASQDRIVQIAGLDGYTLALTQHGRVLKVATGGGFATEAIELVKYSSTTKENNDRRGVMTRFITGAFNNFAVYTKDKVMMGDINVAADTEPTRINALDNQDVCKVSFGE